MAEQFADISSHQHKPPYVDLSRYHSAGLRRILLKATEATGYTNPQFSAWWIGAKAIGIPHRGAYHFSRPSRGTSGTAEANHFHSRLQAVGFDKTRDWACLDVEDTDANGINRAAEHSAEFCRRMVELGYVNGVVYSGKWYLDPARLSAAQLPTGWQNLHAAIYNSTPDLAIPMPNGWARGTLVARQYTSSAIQPGIPGISDANRVVREWLGVAATPNEGNSAMSVQEVRDALNEATAMGFTNFAQMFKEPKGGLVDLARKTFDAVTKALPAQIGLVGTNVANAVAAANTAREQATFARTAAEGAQLAAQAALEAIENATGMELDYDELAKALLRNFASVANPLTAASDQTMELRMSRAVPDTHDYSEEIAAAKARGESNEG